MPYFICTHNTTALMKFVLPGGRALAFDYQGVLNTDDEGAKVIRAHPLYGRLILEGDASASARGEVPALGTSSAVVRERQRSARRPAGSRMDPHGVVVECLACGKRFVQKSWSPRLYCDAKCRGQAYRARKGTRPRTQGPRTAQAGPKAREAGGVHGAEVRPIGRYSAAS